MQHRCIARACVGNPEGAGDVYLEPGQVLDDENPSSRLIIERFPQFFEVDNVERATAAPGEKRQVKRG